MPSARIQLPDGSPAPAAARREIRQRLGAWGCSDGIWVDTVCGVAHELVSNAVRHGGGCTGVLLRLTGDEIIMEVTDRSPAAPGPRDGGYGLLIIGELAEAWGVEPVDEGKRIWVRMARPQVATRSGVHEAGVCRVR